MARQELGVLEATAVSVVSPAEPDRAGLFTLTAQGAWQRSPEHRA
ncbi:hypothetical protein [Streptomyces sp. NRRL S-118]|nr:hypothetical protein [Streptomyces sp. NRRL S-118]